MGACRSASRWSLSLAQHLIRSKFQYLRRAGTNPHWHAETDTHEIVELLKELTLLSRLLGQPTPSFPPTLLHSQPDGIPEGHVLVDSRTAQAMPLRTHPAVRLSREDLHDTASVA